MNKLAIAALLASACTASPTDLTTAAQAIATVPHKKLAHSIAHIAFAADKPALSKADCLAFGFPCYDPNELQKAYGVDKLIAAGHDGTGETIVIIDSFGSPTLAEDLATFDAVFGLPDPPSLQVLAPLGAVPFDPADGDMVNWAFETNLDVQMAHAMAPGASIVVLTSPVDETEGVQGMPEFLALETYALDHHLGHIWSQSWAVTENTLFDAPGRAVVAKFERLYARARSQHVTALAASGDLGATGFMLDFSVYPFPVVGYPASSPNVTAVGGSELSTDDDGNWADEVAWQFSGGGVSQMFIEPLYQILLPRAAQKTLHGHRGVPDLSAVSSGNTPVVCVFTVPGVGQGFDLEAGTSVATPIWAGIVADLNQAAGRPIGFLNDKLYILSELGLLRDVFHDVTVGNNSIIGFEGVPDVVGYNAGKGWDPVTGWGTPKLDDLAQLLGRL